MSGGISSTVKRTLEGSAGTQAKVDKGISSTARAFGCRYTDGGTAFASMPYDDGDELVETPSKKSKAQTRIGSLSPQGKGKGDKDELFEHPGTV